MPKIFNNINNDYDDYSLYRCTLIHEDDLVQVLQFQSEIVIY